MNSPGDAFGFAFKDPAWLGKVVVQGLITIIPIVGWIATAGWLMLAFENARNGRYQLPEAGFHLERGIAIFGVYVIYGIVLSIPGDIIRGLGAGSISQCTTDNVCNNMNVVVGSPLVALGSLISFLASLLLYFLAPTLIVSVYHRGFGGGFDLGQVWAYATKNVGNSVIAGLLMWVAGLIAGLGIIACCIGVFFTIVYAASVNAGLAAWFERQQAAAAGPTLPSAPPQVPG